MLIILFLICNYFGVSILGVNNIIEISLKYITPISIVALIGYIVFSLFSLRVIEIVIGVVLGGVKLYYIFNH